jgi:small subunit ribosomal protein S21
MGKPINVEIRPRDKNESLERMIKRFTKKVKNSKILDVYKERQRYEKPSDKRRKDKARRKKLLEKLHNQRIKQLGTI